MEVTTQKPNFFIVGAPKCGTTAMHSYLEQHPEIFMLDIPDSQENVDGGKKELHFFGSDLNFRRPTLQEYLAYFSEIRDKKILGESTVFYLYSQKAAQDINDFNPDAKILIMLRNPLEMMYSWHSQLLFWGDETIVEFEDALNAESDRKHGNKIPAKHDHPIECFFYSEIARVTVQVKRNLDVFERENVHIVIFDDFKKDTASVYQQTLLFLGCRDKFKPDFQVINSNRTIRNIAVQKFMRHPPKSFRSFVRAIIQSYIRQSLRQNIQQYNTQPKSRSPLESSLKKRLQQEFTPEIEQLSHLLNRDLTYWTQESL